MNSTAYQQKTYTVVVSVVSFVIAHNYSPKMRLFDLYLQDSAVYISELYSF